MSEHSAPSDQATAQSSSVRKHLYLITEHDNDARVGGISVRDSRMSQPLKGEEAPIRVLNEEERDFCIVGKEVYLGYYDFDSEQDYETRLIEVAKKKVREVDCCWAQKADVVGYAYDE